MQGECARIARRTSRERAPICPKTCRLGAECALFRNCRLIGNSMPVDARAERECPRRRGNPTDKKFGTRPLPGRSYPWDRDSHPWASIRFLLRVAVSAADTPFRPDSRLNGETSAATNIRGEKLLASGEIHLTLARRNNYGRYCCLIPSVLLWRPSMAANYALPGSRRRKVCSRSLNRGPPSIDSSRCLSDSG